jgi:hypothetical protein
MSTEVLTTAHIFNTDMGNLLVQFSEVDGYDVENVVRDKAFSQAQILKFTEVAATLDVNAYIGPRTIASSYVAEA